MHLGGDVKTLRIVLLGLVAWGCATNPATGKRQLMLMSEAEEVQIGKQSDADVRKQMGLYQDANLQRYVDRVGQQLAKASHRPNLPWTFAVVDEPAVNAFALPGGYIYITRGILPFLQSEAELAAVMGHEVAHVDARHSASAYSRQMATAGALGITGVLVPELEGILGYAGAAFGLLFLKHGREAELESDRLGVDYAVKNGWEPSAMAGLLNTLGRLDEAGGSSRGVPNWALTHPPAADRVQKVQETVAAARTASPSAKTTNKDEFEKLIDGLVFGDSREKGFVRGNEFLHPILQFAVKFPQGWEIINSDEQVTARRGENSNATMLLQLVNGTGSLQQMAGESMAKAGFQQIDGSRTSINGLDAYVGTYQGVIQNTRVGLRSAYVRAGQRTYVVAGLAPAAEFNNTASVFSSALQTFRPLSREEADRLQPSRVDFVVARAGDSWESIAKSRGAGVKASTLAIMNGRTPATPPRPGERLRIVVGG
jgi:predicted Zn-dependent protease